MLHPTVSSAYGITQQSPISPDEKRPSPELAAKHRADRVIADELSMRAYILQLSLSFDTAFNRDALRTSKATYE